LCWVLLEFWCPISPCVLRLRCVAILQPAKMYFGCQAAQPLGCFRILSDDFSFCFHDSVVLLCVISLLFDAH
jgi:hypothetical protein